MTHGEVWYERKLDVELNDFDDERTVNYKLPEPMNREDAGKYYNKKLFAYWMDQIDDSLSILKKSKIINRYMFGQKNKHQLFKEKQDGFTPTNK